MDYLLNLHSESQLCMFYRGSPHSTIQYSDPIPVKRTAGKEWLQHAMKGGNALGGGPLAKCMRGKLRVSLNEVGAVMCTPDQLNDNKAYVSAEHLGVSLTCGLSCIAASTLKRDRQWL